MAEQMKGAAGADPQFEEKVRALVARLAELSTEEADLFFDVAEGLRDKKPISPFKYKRFLTRCNELGISDCTTSEQAALLCEAVVRLPT